MSSKRFLSNLRIILLLVLVAIPEGFSQTNEQWDSLNLKEQGTDWFFTDLINVGANKDSFDFNGKEDDTPGEKGGAAWWTKNLRNTRGIKITWNPVVGIDEEFTDNIKYPQGYAFCFITQRATNETVPIGKKGTGLGYDGLNQGVCIEFDFIQNKERNDISDPHISLHHNLNGKISATSPTTRSESKFVNQKMPNYYDSEGDDYSSKAQMVIEIVGKKVQIYSPESSLLFAVTDFQPFMQIFEKDEVYFGVTASLNRKKSISVTNLQLLTVSESNSISLSIPGSTSITAGEAAIFQIQLKSKVGTVLKIFPQEYEEISFQIDGKRQTGMTYEYQDGKGLMATLKGQTTAGYYTALAKISSRNTNSMSFNIVAGGGNHLDLCAGGKYNDDFVITAGVTQTLETFSFIVCSYDHYKNTKIFDVAYIGSVTASYPQNFAPTAQLKVEPFETEYQYKVTVPITSTGRYTLFSQYFDGNLYRYYDLSTKISPENSQVFLEGLTARYKAGTTVNLRLNLKDQLGLEINKELVTSMKCVFTDSKVIDSKGTASNVAVNQQSNYVLLGFTSSTTGQYTFAPKFKCGTDEVKEFICQDCNFFYTTSTVSTTKFVAYSDYQLKYVNAEASKTNYLYLSLEESSLKLTTIYPVDESGYQTVFTTKPSTISATLRKGTATVTVRATYNEFGFIDIYYTGSERKSQFDQFTDTTLSVTIGSSTLTFNLKFFFKDDFVNNVKIATTSSPTQVAFFKKPSFDFEVGDSLYLFDLYGRGTDKIFSNGNDLDCAKAKVYTQEGTAAEDRTITTTCVKETHYLAISAKITKAGNKKIILYYNNNKVSTVEARIKAVSSVSKIEYASLNDKSSYTAVSGGINSVATDVSEIAMLKIALKDEYDNIIKDARPLFDTMEKTYSDEQKTHKLIHTRVDENGEITIYDDSHTLTDTSVKFTIPGTYETFQVTLKKKSTVVDPSNSYCYLSDLQEIRLTPKITGDARGIWKYEITIMPVDSYGNVIAAGTTGFSAAFVKSDNTLVIPGTLKAKAVDPIYEGVIRTAGEYRMQCYFGNTPIPVQGEYVDASLSETQAQKDYPEYQRVYLISYHEKIEVKGYEEGSTAKIVPTIVKRSEGFNMKIDHVDEFGNLLDAIGEYTPMLYSLDDSKFQPVPIVGADSESRAETRYYFKLDPADFSKCGTGIYYTIINQYWYYFKFIDKDYDGTTSVTPSLDYSAILMDYSTKVFATTEKPALFKIDFRNDKQQRFSYIQLNLVKLECTDCKTGKLEYSLAFIDTGLIQAMVTADVPGLYTFKITCGGITWSGYQVQVVSGAPNFASGITPLTGAGASASYLKGNYAYFNCKDKRGNACGPNPFNIKEFLKQSFSVRSGTVPVFNEVFYNSVTGVIAFKMDPSVSGSIQINGLNGMKASGSFTFTPIFRGTENLFVDTTLSSGVVKLTMTQLDSKRMKVTSLTGIQSGKISVIILKTANDKVEFVASQGVDSTFSLSYTLQSAGDYLFVPYYSGAPINCENCRVKYTATETVDMTKTRIFFKEGSDTWLEKGEGMNRAFFRYTFPVFKIQFYSDKGNLMRVSSPTVRLGSINMDASTNNNNGEVYAYLTDSGRTSYNALANFQELSLTISASSKNQEYTGFFMLNAFNYDEISTETCLQDAVPSIYNKQSIYLLRAGKELIIEFSLSGCASDLQQFFTSSSFTFDKDNNLNIKLLPGDSYGNYLLVISATRAGSYPVTFKFKNSPLEDFIVLVNPSYNIRSYSFRDDNDLEVDGDHIYVNFKITDEYDNIYNMPGIGHLLYNDIPIKVSPVATNYYPHVKVAFQGEDPEYPFYAEIERVKGGFNIIDPWSNGSLQKASIPAEEYIKLVSSSSVNIKIENGNVTGTITIIDDYGNTINEYDYLEEYLAFYYETYDGIANTRFKSQIIDYFDADDKTRTFSFVLPEGLPIYDNTTILPYFHGFLMDCTGCLGQGNEPKYNVFDNKFYRFSSEKTLFIEHSIHLPIICSTAVITNGIANYKLKAFNGGSLNCLGFTLDTDITLSSDTSGPLSVNQESTSVRVRSRATSETGMTNNVDIFFGQQSLHYISGDVLEVWVEARNINNFNLFYTNKFYIDEEAEDYVDFSLLTETGVRGAYLMILPNKILPKLNQMNFYLVTEKQFPLFTCGEAKVPASFSLKNQANPSVTVMTYEIESKDFFSNPVCNDKMDLYLINDQNQVGLPVNYHTDIFGNCMLTLNFIGKSYLMSGIDLAMNVTLSNQGTKKNIFNSNLRVADTGVVCPTKGISIKLEIVDNYGVDISNTILENLSLIVYEYDNLAFAKLVYQSRNFFSSSIATTYDALGMEIGKKYIIGASMNNTLFTGVFTVNNQYEYNDVNIEYLKCQASSAEGTKDVSRYIVSSESMISGVSLTLEFPLSFYVTFTNPSEALVKASSSLTAKLIPDSKAPENETAIMDLVAVMKDNFGYTVFIPKNKINQYIHLPAKTYAISFEYIQYGAKTKRFLQFNRGTILHDTNLKGASYQITNSAPANGFKFVYEAGQAVVAYVNKVAKSTVCLTNANFEIYNEHLDLTSFALAYTVTTYGCTQTFSQTYRGCVDIYIKCTSAQSTSEDTVKARVTYKSGISSGEDLGVKVNPAPQSSHSITVTQKWPETSLASTQISAKFSMDNFVSVTEDQFKISINGKEISRSLFSASVMSKVITLTINPEPLSYTPIPVDIKVYFKHDYDAFEQLPELSGSVRLTQEEIATKTLVAPSGFRAGEKLDVWLILRDSKGFCFQGDFNISDYSVNITGLVEPEKVATFKFEKRNVTNIEKCGMILHMIFTGNVTKAGRYKMTHDYQGDDYINVYAAALDSSKTIVTREGTSKIPAGETFTLKVSGSDPYDNPVNLYEVQDKFDLQITNPKFPVNYTISKYVEEGTSTDRVVFEINVITTGAHTLTYYYDDKQFKPATTISTITISPGDCTYSDNPSNVAISPVSGLFPGDQINIDITCMDKFGNVVENGTGTNFIVSLTRDDGTITDTYDVPATFREGKFHVVETLNYEGNYLITVRLNSEPNFYGRKEGQKVEVLTLFCPGDQEFKCPDGSCATDKNKENCNIYYYDSTLKGRCSDTDRKAGNYYWVSGKECNSSEHLMSQKSFTLNSKTVQVCSYDDGGKFIAQEGYNCNPATGSKAEKSTCKIKLEAIYGNQTNVESCPDGSCRIGNTPCPQFKLGCPIGYFPCGVKCIEYSRGKCEIPECGPNDITCWDFSCAKSIDECPTQLQCSGYTCMDGRCVSNEWQCSLPPKCKSTEYLCDDNTCKPTKEDCAKKPICPIGYALCENHECRESCDDITKCTSDEVACSNGKCVKNKSQCPTEMLCPEGTFRCPKGGCASTPSECENVQGDSGISCPSSKPILCPNLRCTDKAEDCLVGNQPKCPEHSPFLCWNNECRKSVDDCPSKIQCPASRPVLCNTLVCANGVHHCAVLEEAEAAAGLFRCATGQWRENQRLCPTQTTCPPGSFLCSAGNCVDDIETCPEPTECNSEEFPYRCPDESCRENAEACSSIRTCPSDKPVKCYDLSCRSSIDACPKWQSCQKGYVSCPDGTCASRYSDCNTIVTCLPTNPYLCPDFSCKANYEDCQELQEQCVGGFMCYTGQCLSSRQNCQHFDGCTGTNPVKCSTNTCTNRLSGCQQDEGKRACPIGYTQCPNGECKISENDCSSSECDPATPYLCPEGVCVRDPKYCDNQETGCPYNRPERCLWGKCVERELKETCANETAYPLDEVKEILCPDGSKIKKETGEVCVQRNGCPADKPLKCADGSCVNPKTTKCGILRCPFTYPIQCPNGKCVTSKSDCYSTMRSEDKNTCVAERLGDGTIIYGTYCADGRCVESIKDCRPTYLCDNGMFKCTDGTCKTSKDLCPIEDYCPKERPIFTDHGECVTEELKDVCPSFESYGFSYCQRTGHCYKGDEPPERRRRLEQIPRKLQWFYGSRIEDEMSKCEAPVKSNGCPDDRPFKCSDGRCLVNNTCTEHSGACPEDAPYLCHNGQCSTSNLCEDQTGTCTRTKCKNGQCVDNKSECINLFNCPERTPFLCSNSQCVSDPSQCPVSLFCDADKPILCADGTCVASMTHCKTVWPCGGKAADGNHTFWVNYTCPLRMGVCIDADHAEDCAAVEEICPVNAPIKCPKGNCVTDYSFCFDPSVKCKKDQFWCTRKAECVSLITECFNDGEAEGTVSKRRNLQEWDTENNCPTTAPYSCYDGTCVTNRKLCPIQKPCSILEVRCDDGKCHSVKDGGCEGITGVTCASGKEICEDGLCRKEGTCPPYNGCKKGLVLCPNGKCAPSEDACIGYSMCPEPSAPYRCSTGECVADASNCPELLRNGKVPTQIVTFYTQDTLKFNLAYDSTNRPIATLEIPGNSLQKTGVLSHLEYGTINVREIKHSDVRDGGIYNNTPLFLYNVSSGIESSDGVLGFENSVLSPVIEIYSDNVTNTFLRPGNLKMEFNMYTKKTADFLYTDYCLAKLMGDGEKGRYWECTSRCKDEYTVSFPINSLGIYAVILSPARKEIESGTSKSFFFDNIKTLLIVFLILVVVFGVGYYIFTRVTRYRNKYHENREKIKFLKEQKREYENMTTDVYGQTLGDNIIGLVYTKNQAFSLDQSKMNENASLEDDIEALNLKIRNINRHNEKLQEQIDEMEKKFKELSQNNPNPS